MTTSDSAAPATVDRPCVGLEIPPGPEGVELLMPALTVAMAGTGPAIAPLPGAGSKQSRSLVTDASAPGAPVPVEVAVVIATSGSTGRPAGVLLPGSALHAAALGFAQAMAAPQGHQWVAALPLAHAGGLMVAARSVASGTHPVALSSLGGAERFSVGAFEAATQAALVLSARHQRPLAVALVPPMLAQIAEAGCVGVRILQAYSAVVVGGAATPAALVEGLRADGVPVITSYGMTETCGGAAFDGRALPGVEITADTDGRLSVSGRQVARGYRDGRDPGRWTVRADGTRRFRTDDLGRLDSTGRVLVEGRIDDIVQVAGTSVSLAAIRSVLAAHPGVVEADVVALPGGPWGARVVAALVPVGGVTDPQAVTASAADAVERDLGRAARPRQIHVVVTLPMLASGKVDRQALRAWVQSLGPDEGDHA